MKSYQKTNYLYNTRCSIVKLYTMRGTEGRNITHTYRGDPLRAASNAFGAKITSRLIEKTKPARGYSSIRWAGFVTSSATTPAVSIRPGVSDYLINGSFSIYTAGIDPKHRLRATLITLRSRGAEERREPLILKGKFSAAGRERDRATARRGRPAMRVSP